MLSSNASRAAEGISLWRLFLFLLTVGGLLKKYILSAMAFFFLFIYAPASFAGDATLTWNRNAEPDIAGYKIYYGTASLKYTASLNAGNQTTYTVTGLGNQTYYFAVTAYNLAGSESTYSVEVSKSFTGTGDTLPPLITGIVSGNIASASARITWTTDEPSNSQVQYGLTTAYGSSTSIDTNLVTAHTQTIATLLPGTLYHYRVLSRDAAGNLSTSSDNTFITSLLPDTTAPTIPTNLAATAVSSSQIDLTWSASTDNVGITGYRIYRMGVQVGTSGSRSYSDKAVVPSTTYSYAVSAYDAAGNVSPLSIATSATALPPGATTTVMLRPLADTFLNTDSSVNSTLNTLNTYTWPANRIANAILLKFDLTVIPKGATIQSATLNLALVESDAMTDATYTVTAHKIINKTPDFIRATGFTYDGVNAWTANTCCVNQAPLAQADISTPYDTKAIDKALGYKSWNLTALINEWVNQGVINQGLLINSDPTKLADRYRSFASSEYADATLRPYLSVTYQLPNTGSDTTPPIAQLKAPASGTTVKGSVSVQADLSDNVAVVSVSFFVDGVKQVTQQGTDLKSVSWSWNTAGLTDGTHRLYVQAADAAGLTGNSQEISVTVDNTAPSTPGTPTATSILQDRLTLSWAPSTDTLSSVSYRITRDGTALTATPTTATFTDSGLAPNRSYSYTIAAIDAAGNTSAASSALSAKTLPLAPVVSAPAASALTSTSATLSGPVDPSGASTAAWFEYGTTAAYGSITTSVNLTAAATISTPITSLLPATLYHFRIVAQNAGGKSYGPDQTLTTLTEILPPPPPDLGYTLASENYGWLPTPNPLSLIGDDNFKAVTLPFPFSFYGQTYQQIYIATNGILTFGDGTYAYTPQPIPTPGAPNAYIAPFWRDLYVSAGQISYASSPSEFVVSYTNVRNVCCSLPVFTFQVILRADGTILLQYDTISFFPKTTIGIENQDGTEGITVPAVAPGQAYKFTPVRP
jgi:chitodextrinase